MTVRSGNSRWRSRVVAVFGAVALMGLGVGSAVRADQNEGPTAASRVIHGHIAAGGLHTCARLTSGAVRCWGGNDQGQLGNGTKTTSTAPLSVAGIATATAVTAGNNHTCALLSDGTARCWGLAANGQLGDGTTGDPVENLRLSPVTVSGLAGAQAIAAGGFHTCAIASDGTVRCWGDDGMGQLGDGTPGDRSLLPVPVSGIVAANPAVAITAGEFHTCALLADETLRCWGHNGFGQLGDGTTVNRSTPVAVAGLPAPADNAVQALTVGYGHTCALLEDTTARCWGDNTLGQLGHQTALTSDPDDGNAMVPSPAPLVVQYDADPGPFGVDLQTLSMMTGISAGQFHSCALLASGGGACWGGNGRGQLGADPNPLTEQLDDSSSAVGVSGLAGASAVSAGGFHSCAIVGSDMRCWGYNFYGQLGAYANQSLTPIQVTALTGATFVTAGTRFACALVDGVNTAQPMCWGDNADGRLGAGPSAPSTATIRVAVSGISSADAVDAGNGHACALPAGSQTPKCWGLNAHGQLGDGTTASSSTPVAVSGLTDATAISAGGGLGASERGHTCAVRASTNVVCWGRNANGQLGNDTTTDSSTPVTVRVDTDPTAATTTLVDYAGLSAVSTGGFHSCAIESGKVSCWGANGNGQLGDDTNAERHHAAHVQVDTDPDVDAPLTGVLQIAAGGFHTCAIVNDGTVRCWGAGGSGQLGNGAFADQDRPVTVSGITAANPATAIVAGESHTCVRKQDDSVWCWGANAAGQLGNGGNANSSSPVMTIAPAPSAVPAELRPVISSISASRSNTCARFIDTTVYCWGDNAAGQLGDGIGPTRASATAVSGLGGV